MVMAAKGYPGTPEKGGAIAGLDGAEPTGAKVFHAGTARKGSKLVADGGRVLGVTAARQDRRGGAARGLCGGRRDRLSRPASAAATSAGARSRASEG